MDNAAEKLYNILGTKFDNTDIKTLTSTGKETREMEEIKMFSFDFLMDGKNYGPVVILISAEDNLEVYYGDNTSRSLERNAKKKWENLIEHLSTFARGNRLGFSLKHTTDLKYDLSNIADITESFKNIFESYYGTSKTSYNKQGKAKIIIKHSRKLGEEEKRFRNISQLFIENADGERFKLPFKKLAGARAMARHVQEGGNPYDLFGVHICEMVKDINTLGGFVRRSKMFEADEETSGLVETGRTHYASLRKGLKQIAGKRGYHTFKESWKPEEITALDEDTDAIRSKFLDRKINSKIEEAIPLLARLQKMAEARDRIPVDPRWSSDEELQTHKDAYKKHYTDRDASKDAIIAAYRNGEVEYEEAEQRLHVTIDEPGNLEMAIRELEMTADEIGDIDDYSDAFESWANEIVEGSAEEDEWTSAMGHDQDDPDEMIGEPDELEERQGQGIGTKMATMDIDDIDEFDQRESNLVEGPTSPIDELTAFFQKEQPVGLDAMNVRSQLENAIDDESLYDELSDLAMRDSEADARDVVRDWISNNKMDLAHKLNLHGEYDNPAARDFPRESVSDSEVRYMPGRGRNSPVRSATATPMSPEEKKKQQEEWAAKGRAKTRAAGGKTEFDLAMEEGLETELDADNEAQLNASVNKEVEKHVNEDAETDKSECKWCGNLFTPDAIADHEDTCDYIIPKDLTKKDVTESEQYKQTGDNMNKLFTEYVAEADEAESKKPWEKEEAVTEEDEVTEDAVDEGCDKDEELDEDTVEVQEAHDGPIVTMESDDLGALMQRTNHLLKK